MTALHSSQTTLRVIACRPSRVEAERQAQELWSAQQVDIDMEEVTVFRPIAAVVSKAIAVVPGRACVAPALPEPPPRSVSETVELLSLPGALREGMLPEGERPRSAAQARIAIVRMVRGLARDYRRWYGHALRTDAATIETMQRHLLFHASEVLAGRMDPRSLAPEVVRHGALLGEILARRAGGVWVDLSGDQPALWQMMLGQRREMVVCPVGRVHRFLLRRSKEEDLVAFFLDLEAASRQGPAAR